MSRRSAEDLQGQLDRESAWRKRELGTISAMLGTTRTHEAEMLRRAAVALAYAHWEGFVKAACEAVLSFVAEQRLPRGRVNDALLASSMAAKIRETAGSKKSRLAVELVTELRNGTEERCPIRTSVSTASNLNRDIFDDVMTGIGIDPTLVWDAQPGLTDIDIDGRLLRRRNEIAHGVWLTPDEQECHAIIDAVRALIDATSVACSNYVALREYEVAQA